MKTSNIVANLSFAFISLFSVNSFALDTDCLYGAYSGHPSNPGATPMTKTWGTVTTWTAAEELYYDQLEVHMSFLRMSPFPIVGAGTNKTIYNYESVPQVEIWFVGVNNSQEFWAINPIAIVVLSGENDPAEDQWDHCGPTQEERIII